MYFNTTRETDRHLQTIQQKAETQEEIILNIYRNSRKGLTASEVFRMYPSKNTPLTSIRRAISVLKDEGYLVKTYEKREGIYGRNEFVFNVYTGQLTLFN